MCKSRIKGCLKYCLGYGIIIWMVAYIIATMFVAYEETGLIANIVTTTAVLIVTYLLAKRLQISSRLHMLKFSFSWVIVLIIFDALFTVPFTGWGFFCECHIWLAYGAVFLAPLLAVKSRQS